MITLPRSTMLVTMTIVVHEYSQIILQKSLNVLDTGPTIGDTEFFSQMYIKLAVAS